MNKWTAAAHLEHVDPDIRNNMGGAIYWGRDGDHLANIFFLGLFTSDEKFTN